MTRNVKDIYCFILSQKQGFAVVLVQLRSRGDVLSDWNSGCNEIQASFLCSSQPSVKYISFVNYSPLWILRVSRQFVLRVHIGLNIKSLQRCSAFLLLTVCRYVMCFLCVCFTKVPSCTFLSLWYYKPCICSFVM